jgi:hypothetical protein
MDHGVLLFSEHSNSTFAAQIVDAGNHLDKIDWPVCTILDYRTMGAFLGRTQPPTGQAPAAQSHHLKSRVDQAVRDQIAVLGAPASRNRRRPAGGGEVDATAIEREQETMAAF